MGKISFHRKGEALSVEKFKIITMSQFDRAEHFQYFMSVGTVIELTSKINVTGAVEKCREEKISFQSYMLYSMYKVINTIDAFKYDLVDGVVIQWDQIVPTFSAFDSDKGLFYTIFADMGEGYPEYHINYTKTLNQYAHYSAMVPQGHLPKNAFNVSSIPWLHFEHFSSNSKSMESNIVKMITLGKYEAINGQYLMPVTMQVSHAIADGYHVALFYDRLQKKLDRSVSE